MFRWKSGLLKHLQQKHFRTNRSDATAAYKTPNVAAVPREPLSCEEGGVAETTAGVTADSKKRRRE